MARHLSLLVAACLAIFAAGARADESVPRGQLPDDVRPDRYRLRLTVDPREQHFSGVAEIDATVARPIRTIWLHGLGLEVSAVTVKASGTPLAGHYEVLEPVAGVARVALSSELPAGKVTLRFEYTGTFRDGAEGLYRGKIGDDWYVFSQMQATDARRVFPSFDEPRFKTPFELTVVARGDDRVVANAPLRATKPMADGRVLHEFEPTPPLPTYLLALAVGPLDIVEATLPANAVRSGTIPLRGVATKGKGLQLAYALKYTPSIVARLEEYFGIPFPYAKLDLIASPKHSGGMENAGAIVFEDSTILLGDDAPPEQQRVFYYLATHEISHQWFGDLVTPAWWDDIWLNESFATWMAYKVGDQLRPDLQLSMALVSRAAQAMYVDSKRAGRPMRQAVTDSGQISSTFDVITYRKGAAVLAMIESYLGEEPFRRGVQLHLRTHAHSSATSAEFFAALSEAAKQPAIIEAFRTFVDQPGVPLVSIEPAGDRTADWRIVQERYRPLGSALQGGQLWEIPLCVQAYAGDSASKICTLFTQQAGTLTLPIGTQVVMPNAAGAGYYRFALDERSWDALIAFAPTLPGAEALVLADSVAAAFRAGRIPVDRFLKAAQQLSLNPSRLASTLLGSELVEIKDRWVDPAARAELAARIRALYSPRLAVIGLELRRGAYATEAADRRQLRRSLGGLVALHGRDPAVRAVLTDAARLSLRDPAALDPEFRSLSWSVGVQEMGESFAKALETTLLSSQDNLLRQDAATALGAAEDEASSTRALAVATNPEVRSDELFKIVNGQLQSPVTRDAAWIWLSHNMDRLLHQLPNAFRGSAFELVEPFCDTAHRDDIDRSLTSKASAEGFGMLELQRALETIDLCVAQSSALGPSLTTAIMGR